MEDNFLDLVLENWVFLLVTLPISKYKAPLTHTKIRARARIVGQDFEVEYFVTNDGTSAFPGGTMQLLIVWPNGNILVTPYDIPSLAVGDRKPATPKSTWGVQCRGFGLFKTGQCQDSTGVSFDLHGLDGNVIPSIIAFHSVLGREPGELISIWALIASTISLAILVGEKVVLFLISLLGGS